MEPKTCNLETGAQGLRMVEIVAANVASAVDVGFSFQGLSFKLGSRNGGSCAGFRGPLGKIMGWHFSGSRAGKARGKIMGWHFSGSRAGKARVHN